MTSQHLSPPYNTRSKWLLLHAALGVTVVLSGSYWAIQANLRPELPALRATPRFVRPMFNDPRVISDDQLTAVLNKLHPRFQEHPPKLNNIDHGLRMWGVRATFADEAYSGEAMRNMLLNHQQFTKTWGPSAPALLEHTPLGIQVRTQEGKSTVSHEDHLLGTLAECGVPLSAPVVTAQGPGRVQDLLLHALRSFRLNQQEYEWTTLATAFYLNNAAGWHSREGQFIDFNQLADRLMRQDQPQGVCYGQHRIYTLTMLLRIDQQMRNQEHQPGLVTDTTRASIHDYLAGMTSRLCETQSQNGYWDGNWPDTSVAVPDPTTDERSRRILATGHALEWWAMAPESLHPPRETIVRAAQWLSVTIEGMDERAIEANFTFLTHAGRSLALWRGVFPQEFERKRQVAARLASHSSP